MKSNLWLQLSDASGGVYFWNPLTATSRASRPDGDAEVVDKGHIASVFQHTHTPSSNTHPCPHQGLKNAPCKNPYLKIFIKNQ